MGKVRSTIRDVAERAGVSVATVSNHINDNKPIAPDTLARIEAAIRDLDFVPNRAVRVMQGGRNPAIGYVVAETPDSFFVEVARGIEDVARSKGLVLVSCNTQGLQEHEESYLSVLAEMRVAGAIVMPSFESHPALFRRLRASGAAVIVLGDSDDDTCSVSFDDFEGGRMAMEHLLSLGHERLLFVGGPGGQRQVERRYQGALAALTSAGRRHDDLDRIDVSDTSRSARIALAEKVLAMAPRPMGVFCVSDAFALSLMTTLLRAGVSVPDEVSIVGFNDIPESRDAIVPLTTIAVPQHEMGRVAAQLLLDELKADHVHRTSRFPPHLVIRASTARAAR